MLELNKRLPVVRLYFNQKEDYPNVWSIDDGDQANEINVSWVITQGVACTQYTGEKKSKNAPVAWLSFSDAEVTRLNDDLFFINNSSDY